MSGGVQPSHSSESAARHLLSGPLEKIELKREQQQIEIEALIAAAGVPRRSYLRWRQNNMVPARPVLQRLEAALDRLSQGAEVASADRARLIAVCLGAYRVAAGLHLPDSGDRAARIKDLSIYGAALFGGIAQHELAKETGVSRAAICLTIRRVEDRRDASPAFDAACRAVIRSITGEED